MMLARQRHARDFLLYLRDLVVLFLLPAIGFLDGGCLYSDLLFEGFQRSPNGRTLLGGPMLHGKDAVLHFRQTVRKLLSNLCNVLLPHRRRSPPCAGVAIVHVSPKRPTSRSLEAPEAHLGLLHGPKGGDLRLERFELLVELQDLIAGRKLRLLVPLHETVELPRGLRTTPPDITQLCHEIQLALVEAFAQAFDFRDGCVQVRGRPSRLRQAARKRPDVVVSRIHALSEGLHRRVRGLERRLQTRKAGLQDLLLGVHRTLVGVHHPELGLSLLHPRVGLQDLAPQRNHLVEVTSLRGHDFLHPRVHCAQAGRHMIDFPPQLVDILGNGAKDAHHVIPDECLHVRLLLMIVADRLNRGRIASGVSCGNTPGFILHATANVAWRVRGA
mmetsp:Transcript_116555/g.329654  ORF Transcript_116555/g.329654 Transcript_116555/m.329654 type:complete len:386 (+) Transcript_116555:544-1701(+)